MERLVKQGKENEFFEALDALSGVVDAGHENKKKATLKIQAALSAFMERPKHAGKAAVIDQVAKIRAATTKSDLPDVIVNMPEIITAENNTDMGYELAFKEVQTDPGRNYWEIVSVTKGFSVQKLADGEKVQVGSISGSKVQVFLATFGLGVEWTREMVQYRQYSTMIQIAERVRHTFFEDKADRHYTLLTTAGTDNVANAQSYNPNTRTTTTDPVVADIETINGAAFKLANTTKDKGFGDTSMAQMILYANPTIKDRVLRALREQGQAFAGSGARINWPIQAYFTFNGNMPSTATTALLVLPGRKIQRAEGMAPTFYNAFDHLSLSTVQTMFAEYGAAVADSTQVVNVAFA